MIHIYSFVISPILIQYFSDKAKYCSYCNLLFPKNLYIRDFCCFDYSIAAVTSRYLIDSHEARKMVDMNLEEMSSLWTVTVTVYPSQNGTSYSVRLQFEIDHLK